MALTERQAAAGCLTAALQSQAKETAWHGTARTARTARRTSPG